MSESGSGEPVSDSGPSDKEASVECPACGGSFDTERGMKIHHKNVHGESIAGVGVECHWCGSAFRMQRTDAEAAERNFCPDADCQSQWRAKHYSGDGNPQWAGGEITRPCGWCGDPVSRQPAFMQSEYVYCNLECKGKHHSERFKGENHWEWRGLTVHCDWCGGELDREPNQIREYKHHFCGDKRCQEEWQSEYMSGENHWNWQGGLTPLRQRLRNNIKYEKWRTAVYERDDYTCQKCGATDKYLNAHHIIPASENLLLIYDPENGITLCVDCHKEEHPDVPLPFKSGHIN